MKERNGKFLVVKEKNLSIKILYPPEMKRK